MNQIAFRSRTPWAFVLAAALAACTAEKNPNAPPAPPATPDAGTPPAQPPPDPNKTAADKTFDEGKDIFRNDTFGDQAFWTDVLHIDQAIAGCPTCGLPGGVSPQTALSVGLKVDIDVVAANPDIVAAITGPNRAAVLADPATTLLLISKGAVLGVKPTADGKVGLTCAVCHSTVDNAGAAAPVSLPGVGHRLDGWPNRDLDVGSIVALSPNIAAVTALLNKGGGTLTDQNVKDVLHSWGPGKFDAELFMDGKAFNPSPNPVGSLTIVPGAGASASTLIPAAFGLRGVNLHTYTGWGSITQWNAFVAVLEMHGKGNYSDERLNNQAQFPVAVANGFFNVAVPPDQDQVSSKLGPLQFYQLALDAPAAPAGSFDQTKANAGKVLFNGTAKCATCHVPPLFTDAGWNMHPGADIGIDDFQASRTPLSQRAGSVTPVYRTTPLRGVFARAERFVTNPAAKGRYYHDGRFATLDDVVAHYNTTMSLALSPADQSNLVEYLKSL
jgi:hypothetical protein